MLPRRVIRAMCIGDPFYLCWAPAALVIAILCAASAGVDIIATSLHKMRQGGKGCGLRAAKPGAASAITSNSAATSHENSEATEGQTAG